MFFFEGFIVMFLAATPLAFAVVVNRDRYKLPRVMFYLSLATIFSATFILIGFVGVMLNG